MKPAPLLAVALLLAAPAHAAEDGLISFNETSVWFQAALGKQVDVRFSEEFASGHLDRTDFDAVVVSGLTAREVCLFGQHQGLDPADPRLRDVARAEEGDICLPRSEVSVRAAVSPGGAASAMPFYSTDKASCAWSWRSGGGLGLWTEDCAFDSGRWDVAYDETNDWFALRVDGRNPYPVVRPFRVAPGGGLESLLHELKARGLVLDDPDCVFDVTPQQLGPDGWTTWQIYPVGARKDAFEAQPKDEVPAPPCGDLGMAVDSISFFAMSVDHPERAVYINLGQDGTMIDPFSIIFN